MAKCPEAFASKFEQALNIAKNDSYRATTHNKGIYNGIDAVVIATGNDFRAIEACGHTYASRNGQYGSLSDANVDNGWFRFSLKVPLAVGTVGGLTRVHPLAKRSLELLDNPTAEELMEIIASVGLAQNFVGSNNINLLEPNGQFGTRLHGGDDSASERYIFTQLNSLTRSIFPDADDSVLNYLNDDGTIVEPEYYVPIIPFALMNGISGIGTGFSCNIASYNPLTIVDYLNKKLKG